MSQDFRSVGSMPRAQRIRIGGIAIVAFLVLTLASTTWYTVEPEEVAVVTRFGAYNRTEYPGLHFKWPFGIERADRVKKDRNQKEEFGFRTVRADIRTQYSQGDYSQESIMLTGDLNQADVEWTIQYNIKDPQAYLFNVRAPDQTLRAIAESSMRAVVGDRSVTEVLTIGKTAVEEECRTILQNILNQYESGIHIVFVKLQDVFPPEQVKSSFTDVEAAKQEKQETILRAQQTYNQEIPAAEGVAKQLITEAEGYRIDRVNRAQGEADRFKKVLAEYQKAPEVTRRRLYLEAMREVLPQMKSKIVIDDGIQGVLPLLDLGALKENDR